MNRVRKNTQFQAALLRNASRVDAPVKNSLCCAAAGITASLRATAEILISHEKLRGAAAPEATLIAQSRPLAQPVEGYMYCQNKRDSGTTLSKEGVKVT